jgi:DegV family protein with EDD domain
MPKIHIVTDSGARFSNPRLIKHYPVTIIPNEIEIAGKRYKEDIDLTTEEALGLTSMQKIPPKIIPPSESEYAELFSRLSYHYDAVISIHPSRELSESWQNGRRAAQQVSSSQCEIAIVDSRSLCAGQGMLVRVAARAIQEQQSVEDIVQAVRGAVDRIYSVYYVEELEYLRLNRIMKPSHAILSMQLGIKPFVSLEEGKLIVIEKVRTRSQAIERLVEFLVEFIELDDAVILQHRHSISEETRLLQDRLSVEFPGQHFPFVMYSGTMASYLGSSATGIVVLEKEMDDMDYDF